MIVINLKFELKKLMEKFIKKCIENNSSNHWLSNISWVRTTHWA